MTQCTRYDYEFRSWHLPINTTTLNRQSFSHHLRSNAKRYLNHYKTHRGPLPKQNMNRTQKTQSVSKENAHEITPNLRKKRQTSSRFNKVEICCNRWNFSLISPNSAWLPKYPDIERKSLSNRMAPNSENFILRICFSQCLVSISTVNKKNAW